MNYTIYKPNKAASGGLGSFRVSKTKKGDDWVAQLFVELVPQSSWDDQKRVGSFDNSGKKCIMLNANEAGEMIHAINTKGKWTSYHNSDTAGGTSITFGEWKDSMVLSVTGSDKKNHRISANFGECECLKLLLEHFIKVSMELDGKNKERKFKESQQ